MRLLWEKLSYLASAPSWMVHLLGQNYMYLQSTQSPFEIITGHVLSSQAGIYYGSLFRFFTSTSECFHFWFISDAAAIEFSTCIHPEFILTVLSV